MKHLVVTGHYRNFRKRNDFECIFYVYDVKNRVVVVVITLRINYSLKKNSFFKGKEI